VLFVYLDRFQAVQLAGDIENAVVFLTDENHVRDANEMARALFPSLEDAVGEPFAQAVPAVADYLDGDSVMEREVDGETRYFRVASTPFTFGGTRVGLMVVLTDVTREEQYRRQIERQNERLGRFASVVSHDLRNPLNVAKGRLELEREHRDSENLEAVSRALHRMERLVSDVLFLAREGVDIGDRSAVSLSESAERAWQSIAAGGASYVQDGDLAVEADDDRLVQLLENLFRNAVEYGGPDVSIHVGSLDDERGFYVEDDGPGIPEGERDDVFEMGVSSGGGTGIGLAIVRTIAEAHGWSVSVTDAVHGEAETPGARFEIFGVDVAGDEAEQADVEAAASGPTSDE
jgi:signal transduction histidine kinase